MHGGVEQQRCSFRRLHPAPDGRRTNGAHGREMANVNGGGTNYSQALAIPRAKILNRIGGIE